MPAVFTLPLTHKNWRELIRCRSNCESVTVEEFDKCTKPRKLLTSPIPLSQTDVDDFKQVFFEEYGIKLSDNDARERAIKVLLAVKATYKPMESEKLVANSTPIEYGVGR